ncbi:DUF4124 domain-containing protein [Nitrospina gracilis]|uniref:DUF4124 domain-containing protein n=1 Tax=Nitrospina gracilis TaxID=35801 RepID=UPI001F360161|nr:DUF4124 domain-containing protein [Nitrospina gracilis]MCF8721703.1 hypothetical protein [Nitrospina gracilis Nb-211]
MRHLHPRALILLAAVLLATSFASPAAARYIYMYTDDQGVVHYSDFLSGIPPEYRGKARAKFVPDKKLQSKNGGDQASEDSGGSGKSSTTGSSDKEQVGLSQEQERLMNEAKSVLNRMVPLGAKYRDVQKNFTNGRRMYSDIQSNLSVKKDMVAKLGNAKNPLLVQARGFVQSSISQDEDTVVNTGTPKRKIYDIYARFESESKQAASLIQKIDQAIQQSIKDKAEAEAKAKAEAAKKSETK